MERENGHTERECAPPWSQNSPVARGSGRNRPGALRDARVPRHTRPAAVTVPPGGFHELHIATHRTDA
ncbi:hypothetical protein GCM10009801_03510 [Streptomyces albiaxialis]|uniref:Uncharacterized protein n=1 Tax=Streptomyces albiaxialis TaxID=329523 RepID=A0ABP5GZI3_9ACTN